MAMFGRQHTPWLHDSTTGPFGLPPADPLPDYMAGINEALARNAARGADQKQSPINAGLARLGRDFAKWQQDSAASSNGAAERQAAMMARARQAYEAMLNMPRPRPGPPMGFGPQFSRPFSSRGF